VTTSKRTATTTKTNSSKMRSQPRRRTPRSSGAGAAPNPRAALPSPSDTTRDAARVHASRLAAEIAIDAALEKKALLPVLLDVSERASYTDFIVIVSGRSDRQVEAIAAYVREVMEERGWRLIGREGAGGGRWTLLDFGDVVVHAFYHPVREMYDIEGLWIDAPRVKLQVPPEAQLYQSDALYGIG